MQDNNLTPEHSDTRIAFLCHHIRELQTFEKGPVFWPTRSSSEPEATTSDRSGGTTVSGRKSDDSMIANPKLQRALASGSRDGGETRDVACQLTSTFINIHH